MKKGLLFPILGLFLVGCANQDLNDGTGDNGIEVPSSRNFLSLTVVPTSPSPSTRAPEGTYVDGDDSEGNVKTVRFYFFDGGGNPTPVWENRSDGSYNSYLDWYPNASDIDDGIPDKTIETTLHTTLGITVPAGKSNPESVVAIINPTTAILGLNNSTTITVGEGEGQTQKTLYGPSMTTLRGLTADYYTDLHDNNFVMSNSVYVETKEGQSSVIDYTALEETNFMTEEDEAAADPVAIYVERVLARLDFGIGTTMTSVGNDSEGRPIYKAGDYTVDNASGQAIEGKTSVYVKFLGWNVTSTAATSRLLKDVNPAWQSNTLFENTQIWNTSDYFRSFWAINPDGLEYQYGSFGLDAPATDLDDDDDDDDDNGDDEDEDTFQNVNPANALEIADAGEYTTTYLQENANKYGNPAAAAGPESPTKVILAAQLCNAQGESLSLAEWNYHKFLVQDMVTFLCANELNQLWKAPKGVTPVTYSQIATTDVMFKTAQQLGIEDSADYFTYVVLSPSALKDNSGVEYQWYLKNLDGTYTTYTEDQVNNYILDKINHVRVWNTGWTYYFFNVQHLGAKDSPGYYGIVRNHAYKATLKSLQGLGTPVYDPEQEIIPEENTYDESIVTAEVYPLQWRVVANDYEIKWK
ncbi:MAG: fimbria major subunit [Muribaculaceae bacterium]|nr:fimbria major subunit [Muribaculaceae bacterium]